MGRTKPIVSNEYVVGLTDGEGCFHVNMGIMPAYKSGVRVQMHFHIKMQEKDRPLLEKSKKYITMWSRILSKRETRQSLPMLSIYRIFTTKHLGKNNPFLPETSSSKRF